jgi:DNA-3-methyladenine glycosylase I
MKRCWNVTDPLLLNYHDTEWGAPVHDDRLHFEFLLLECFQAGLNWSMMLRKRESFRKAFDNFNPRKIARYNEKKLAALLSNPGIIRNSRKISAAVNNAQKFLDTAREFGSFDRYIWSFVDGKPVHNRWQTWEQVPVKSPVSDVLSLDLKKRGFRFVGSTTMYAHMQSIGLVNDHLTFCFRWKELNSGRLHG